MKVQADEPIAGSSQLLGVTGALVCFTMPIFCVCVIIHFLVLPSTFLDTGKPITTNTKL